jgi:hypothetical protein
MLEHMLLSIVHRLNTVIISEEFEPLESESNCTILYRPAQLRDKNGMQFDQIPTVGNDTVFLNGWPKTVNGKSFRQ